VGRALAKWGYTTVVPNYRLYPEVQFPSFVEDGARAVKWVQDTYEPTAIILMGHSAGAYIPAMLSLKPDYLAEAGASLSLVAGFIGLSGPYDFHPRPGLRPVFGGAKGHAWSPIHNVPNRPSVPMLLLHGRLDLTVRPSNSLALAREVTHRDGSAKAIIYPAFEHMGLLTAFMPGLGRLGSVKRDILAFIDKNK
jgi:acetyl esterase/lipase